MGGYHHGADVVVMPSATHATDYRERVHPLAVDPQPDPQRVAPRAAADPGLRAVHRRSGSSSRLALPLRRWRERGGIDEDIWDVSGWAIVFGILGGRLYHVITDPELYFEQGRAPDRRPQDLGRRPRHLGRDRARRGRRLDRLPPQGHLAAVFADAAVPGVVLAQGIGRWGNWFNNELYGGPTSLPWSLQIH